MVGKPLLLFETKQLKIPRTKNRGGVGKAH
jgi:hypothetical protein